jgi:hypothetical protein
MPLRRNSRLPLVTEAEATGRTREIYQEIKLALGLPHVNLFFQAFGPHPEFLELQWRAFRPVVSTGEFFRLAERLRAEAYTRVQNYFRVPDLCGDAQQKDFSPGALHEMTGVVELFHYNNPLLLLICAAQTQALEEVAFSDVAAALPPNHPQFTVKPTTVPEESAPAPTRKLYEEIKAAMGLTFVNTDYRAFARWPDFLAEYWRVLKPALASPLYGEHKRRMCESALSLALELPAAPDLGMEALAAAGIDDEECSAIVKTTDLFLNVLSGLVLNVAFAKIGLEGGTDGQFNSQTKPDAALPERHFGTG